MRRVWVVGPVAWDSVYYLKKLPQPGRFEQSLRNHERPGGTAANAAIAIASSGIDTGFVGYIGDDKLSEQLNDFLKSSYIKHLHLHHLEGKPSHVAIFIDSTGERTIIGLSQDRLDQVTLSSVDLQKGDVVVFPLWRNHFESDLQLAKKAQCITVVGLQALSSNLSADVAIGSLDELDTNIDISLKLNFYSRIVVTQGSRGAVEYSKNGLKNSEALKVDAVDTTGAGDAFLAGYVTAMALEIDDSNTRLRYGNTWASRAVQVETSIPPNWIEVKPFLID